MLLKPKNILSIDHLKPITIENQEYKSISYYIHSKVVCNSNKRIVLNAQPSNLRKEFALAFQNCYFDFLLDNIKRALEIKFSNPKYFQILLSIPQDKIYYITYSKNKVLGVDDNLQGENKIGEYMMEIRNKYRDQFTKNLLEKVEAKEIDKVFIIHMEYDILRQYVQETKREVNEANVDKILISGYSKLLTSQNLETLIGDYVQTHNSLKDIIPTVLQPLLLSSFDDLYKKSIYDLYKRKQLSQAEYNQDRIGYRTEVYFDLLNQNAVEKKSQDEIKNEKYELLSEYLRDFFSRHYPNSDRNTMTRDFLQDTEEHKIQSLADRLWIQVNQKQLPEYLYDQLNQKKQQLLSLRKFEEPIQEEQLEGPISHVFDVKYQGKLVIRETFDPLNKANSKLSMTLSDPYVIDKLGYPTLMHYVYARTGTLGSLDRESVESKKAYKHRDIVKSRRNLLVKPSVSFKSTNIYDFKNLDECKTEAFKFASYLKNIHMYRYLQQAIYEKILRDPDFAYLLKIAPSDIVYYDPSNLFLGVNDEKQGKNMVGKLLSKIQKELKINRFIPMKIPIVSLLQDNGAKKFINSKIQFITEIISIFGEYINLPRHGFVVPNEMITEDAIQYITTKVTSGCVFTNTTYAVPNSVKTKIIEYMNSISKYKYSKHLVLYVWNYIYQLLLVYYFYIYKSSSKEKTRIMQDIDSFGSVQRDRSVKILSSSLNNIQQVMYDYVHDSQDELEYSMKILLGKEEFDKFIQNNNMNDLRILFDYVNNDRLWKRVLYFSSL